MRWPVELVGLPARVGFYAPTTAKLKSSFLRSEASRFATSFYLLLFSLSGPAPDHHSETKEHDPENQQVLDGRPGGLDRPAHGQAKGIRPAAGHLPGRVGVHHPKRDQREAGAGEEPSRRSQKERRPFPPGQKPVARGRPLRAVRRSCHFHLLTLRNFSTQG